MKRIFAMLFSCLITHNCIGAKLFRLEIIDDFERPTQEGYYWYGSGQDANVNVESVTGIGQIDTYALKIDYTIYSFNYEQNWITLRRTLGIKDLSQGDGITLYVKGTGSGGEFRVILEDVNKNRLQYTNTTVLDANKWMKIQIPFAHLTTQSYIEARHLGKQISRKMDFSKITAIEFQIALPNNGHTLFTDIPLKGVCYIDQIELVSGLFGLKKPLFDYIPDGYTLTEYYKDEELGDGIYQTLNIADRFDYKNISLYGKIAIPSKLVLSGYRPLRIIDWMRGDDIRIYNKQETAISIKELYLSFREPVRYINSFRLGTLWLHWSPFAVYGQSKYAGMLFRGTIGRSGEYESFLATDYWMRKYLYGVRFLAAAGNEFYFTPMLLAGQWIGRYQSTNKSIADYRLFGIDFKYNKEKISVFNKVVFSILYSNFIETQYGYWEKENPWDETKTYEENLTKSLTGGVIFLKEYERPLVLKDNAMICAISVDGVEKYPIGFKLEGRYIGENFAGVGYKEAMLPWMREDSQHLLKVERRNAVSIIQNKYRHIIGSGYTDQNGINLKVLYNLGKGFKCILENDLKYRISKPDLHETRLEAGAELTIDQFRFILFLGTEKAKESSQKQEEIQYQEFGVKYLPIANLEFIFGYRTEKRHTLISERNKEGKREINYLEAIYKILPNVNLNFRMKKSNPQIFEYGGAIGDTRDGDYKEWSDHMPDDYTQLVLRIDF